ncbi:MAG: hypothetical protein DRK00_01470 [Thermoprotei archaeon]|nr:MAG: hypothetical protein DRK00_01470 [Thermoprotei archaeon]
MGLKLKELEAEGFRAFSGRVRLRLEGGVTLLYGPPGSGKTSIVRALEYALFGSTREVRARALRREDLINDQCDEARVRVVLVDEEGEIEVERTLDRRGRTKLRVAIGASELLDERGEEYLRERVGMSLEEFAREVAIGHLELYALAYAPPSTRNRLIDGMLGIGELERLYRELSGREVRGYIEALEDEARRLNVEAARKELESIEEEVRRIRERRKELREELEKLRAERRVLEERRAELLRASERVSELVKERARLEALLESLGGPEAVRAPRVSRQYLVMYAEKLKREAADLLEDLYLGAEAEELRRVKASDLDAVNRALGSALERAKGARLRLEYEVERARGEVEELEDEVRELEDELAHVESEIRELEDSRWRYESLAKKYGEPGEVARKAAQLEVKLKSLRAERGKAACVKALQAELLGLLKKRGEAECPVCGSKVIDATSLPKVEAPERLEREAERLERELRELQSIERELRRLEPALRDLSELAERRRELEEELNERLEELEEARARVDELETHLASVNRRIADLSTARERFEEYLKRLRAQELKARLDKVRTELAASGYDEEEERRILEHLGRLEARISKIEEELKELEEGEREATAKLERAKAAVEAGGVVEEKLTRVKQLYETLMKVREAIREAHVTLRQKLVERLSTTTSELFRAMNVYGEYDEVRIEVKGAEDARGRHGHYVFYVRRVSDGNLVPAASRLSDGQRALLTLSLVLALNELKERGLSLIILDDPVPNVDDETKRAIVEHLAKWRRDLQVLVTTQSKRLAEEMRGVIPVYDVRELYGMEHAKAV